LRAEVYSQLSEAGVAKLSETEIARIWAARFGGKNREAVAKEFDLPLGVIDFAFRNYQRQLESLISSESGIQLAQQAGLRGVGIAGVAKAKGLSFEAARYVIGAVKNKAKHRREKLADIAIYAEWVVSRVKGREAGFGSEFRRNEFTPDELLKSKGKVVGQYAPLYDDCVVAQSADLPADEAKHVTEFLDLVRYTFDQRTQRRESHLHQVQREKTLMRPQFTLMEESTTETEISWPGSSPSEVASSAGL